MPDGINGIFFENQILTAKGLGAFANAAVSDGILTGCKASISGLSITIDEGYIMICGRVVKIPSQSFNLNAGTNHVGTYSAIIATVDTTATSDEDTFGQVSLNVVDGDTSTESPLTNLHSGYNPTSGFTYDINMSGQTASTWLVLLRTTSAQASVTRYNYANALAMDRLWTNPDPTSSFSEQSISIPFLNNYDAVLVVYRKTNEDARRQSMICPYSRASTSGEYTYDIIHSTLGDTTPYTNVMRQRRMTITPYTGTIYFSVAWATGNSSSNNGSLIPVELFGLRAGSIHY